MNNTNCCPKCDGKEILTDDDFIAVEEQKFKGSPFNTKFVRLQRFICVNCGYSEQWLHKEGDLEKVRKIYNKRNS